GAGTQLSPPIGWIFLGGKARGCPAGSSCGSGEDRGLSGRTLECGTPSRGTPGVLFVRLCLLTAFEYVAHLAGEALLKAGMQNLLPNFVVGRGLRGHRQKAVDDGFGIVT